MSIKKIYEEYKKTVQDPYSYAYFVWLVNRGLAIEEISIKIKHQQVQKEICYKIDKKNKIIAVNWRNIVYTAFSILVNWIKIYHWWKEEYFSFDKK
jgi:hypothetical protein